MGNSASSESDSTPQVGYHVLQVQPSSPGSQAGLQSFFDFIVEAQGAPLMKEDSTFVEILKSNLGKQVKLIVYNTKFEKFRETYLIPSNNWGGSGLAGISIRFCSFDHARDYVWHVVDVYPNSPAAVAGLQPRTDYIVGTPDVLFNDSEDFYTLISSNEGKSIPIYVYSTVSDSIRLTSIVPNQNWGGTGSLGADIGFGLLHRIPTVVASSQVPQSVSPQQLHVPHAQPLQQHSNSGHSHAGHDHSHSHSGRGHSHSHSHGQHSPQTAQHAAQSRPQQVLSSSQGTANPASQSSSPIFTSPSIGDPDPISFSSFSNAPEPQSNSPVPPRSLTPEEHFLNSLTADKYGLTSKADSTQ
eukprot:TRINITY_DN9119_c0_g1_i2.p1 TRINITY_DN9119_c0_g1~~TRINITY_DN9119_c0_g1_i2.p1  ORF type:complete len:356 (+),score=60.92 TRINITY_DN9119_c0_g1_i2:46-1113(+)